MDEGRGPDPDRAYSQPEGSSSDRLVGTIRQSLLEDPSLREDTSLRSVASFFSISARR